jgi:hypothetical protein
MPELTKQQIRTITCTEVDDGALFQWRPHFRRLGDVGRSADDDHLTSELFMFIKRYLFPIKAFLWTLCVLVLFLPLLGLFGPRPGAPLGDRSLGIGDLWLIRIVETATPSGVSWVMSTNWMNLILCATVGGVAIAWIRSGESVKAEQSGEREPPITRI